MTIKKRNKEFEPDTLIKCAVCGNPIMAFGFNGWSVEPCKKCGWTQEKCHLENPDKTYSANFVSLNKAKQLFKAGKHLTPDFEDFVAMLKHYAEVEFTYNGTRYEVFKKGETGVVMADFNGKYEQLFETIDDFKTNAKINNVLLKDLWNRVIKANYIQD